MTVVIRASRCSEQHDTLPLPHFHTAPLISDTLHSRTLSLHVMGTCLNMRSQGRSCWGRSGRDRTSICMWAPRCPAGRRMPANSHACNFFWHSESDKPSLPYASCFLQTRPVSSWWRPHTQPHPTCWWSLKTSEMLKGPHMDSLLLRGTAGPQRPNSRKGVT